MLAGHNGIILLNGSQYKGTGTGTYASIVLCSIQGNHDVKGTTGSSEQQDCLLKVLW